MPGSDEQNIKPSDMPCVVLEQIRNGVLYIFTDRPIRKGYDSLSWRTATIFPSDFTIEK